MQTRKSVLVIGVGSIGERHVRCFQATGRVDVAICEVQSERRQRAASQYGIQRAYASVDELRQPDVRLAETFAAAVICTPADLHIPVARQLTAEGLSLLIEKPLSTSTAGVSELIDEVEHRRTTVAVAYVMRSNPLLAAMKQAIDSGRFGAPVEIVAVGGQHFPTYRPAYREIYYTQRATGGGAIQDALTHMVDTGQWLVGPIRRVAADAAHQVLEGVEVEDTVHVLARHGAVLGSYSLNQHQAPNELTMTVVCQRGTVRFESHASRWRWMTEPGGSWTDDHRPLERDDVFIQQADAFLDALEGRRPPLCSLAEARQTLHANLAILKAWETQAWVDCAAG